MSSQKEPGPSPTSAEMHSAGSLGTGAAGGQAVGGAQCRWAGREAAPQEQER